MLAGTIFNVSVCADTEGIEAVLVQETLTQSNTQVKNIIIMIPDGQSVTDTTLARWYKGGEPLAVDEMACGLVRTYSSDAPIADSAPSGTAYATGFKSHTGFVGVLPDVNTMPGMELLATSDKRKPIATILEAAQLLGKSTGIIATSEIMHATPADFTSHDPSRKNYDSLSEQEVYQDIDVVLGSGEYYLTPEGRKDGENLVEALKNMGYDYITTPEEMRTTTSSKIWGMFAPKDLSYEMDRDASKQPSLAEMTEKAIDVLSKNEQGFFLMVEGSKVDWASHANDPIGVISDTLAYDDAVKVALDFAKKDGNTVVISVTDHGNGGMTIGSKATDNDYDKRTLNEFIEPLKKATKTGEGIEKLFNDDMSNIAEVMAEYYGIDDLTEEEIEEIKNTEAGSMNYTVGPMISKRANIGWTTNGHTGEDIPLYIYAPKGCEKLSGVVENTDIANYMARLFGIELSEATSKLFVPVRDAAEAKGAKVEWNADDAENPVIIITKDGNEIKIPINKNIAYVNGTEVKLDGVTVFNGLNTYVPQSAIDLIK
ncbi:MAG: alkaline phosphatase [Clostridia bacterium]